MKKTSVVIDQNRKYQTITGFGGCMKTWVAETDYLSEDWYDTLVYDLGVSAIRIPLAASFAPSEVEEGGLRPEVLESRLCFAREFTKRGVKTVLGSLWSPPRWMKTNRCTFHGGSLRPDMRESFADFMASTVQAAGEEFGVDFYGVSPQNELLFVEPYHSCVYSPQQIREVVRAMGRAFKRKDLQTQITLPESMGFAYSFQWYTEPLLQDTETREIPGFFSVHGSGGRDGIENWRLMRDVIKDTGKQLWMTETDGSSEDWSGALALAKIMHDALVGGNISTWLMWQLTDILEKGCKKPGYWVNKHFFKYIRPGMIRVQAAPEEGELLASAYTTPDGSTVTVVLINMGNQHQEVSLQASSAMEPDLKVFISTENEKFTGMDSVKPDFSKDKIEYVLQIPARSIVTLVAGNQNAVELDGKLAGKNGAPELAKIVPQGRQLLFEASDTMDVERIRELLAQGHPVEEMHLSGSRPLHNAAYGCNPEIIKVLVEAGADLEVRDDNRMTPLLLAANRIQTEQVEAFLACGADVHAKDYTGWTALHYAAISGSIRMVEILLAAGACAMAKANDGWTPLHAAVSAPYATAPTIARMLIHAGAEVNAASLDGWTPLHAAAANCNTVWDVPVETAAEKIRLLMAAGADIHSRDKDGNTPLHWAARMGHFSCDEKLPANIVVHTGAVAALIAAGAQVDAVNEEGCTPLQYAATEGFAAIAAVLLQAKQKGKINQAAENSVPAEIQEKAPAKLNCPELIAAVQRNDLARVKELLEKGMNVDSTGVTRNTALHFAAMKGYDTMTLLLLDHGAKAKALNSDGFTPEDLAVQKGRTEIVDLLKRYPWE